MTKDELIKKIEDNPEFTEEQWESEMQSPGIQVELTSGPFSFGKSLPCPVCEVVGFYGPRVAGQRKYRACKFCGFWQEVPKEPLTIWGNKGYRCTHIYCPNGHEYDWVHPNINEFRNCKTCNAKLEKTDWASDNPNHPFQNIKLVITNFLKTQTAANE